ncbi:hypothetical protein BpHYR1_008150 [Brachionus plicatilis]|uniref:Uncharacterized protein n=1 Tax=Brachionus plicatilis TaxID=10195 RepID=A0A3M7PRD1_BRAPC|nr:hypothetical protein BpHYR1_008150 [Brachionus plicatilis]
MFPFCVPKKETTCLEKDYSQLILEQQKLIQEIYNGSAEVLAKKFFDLINRFLINDYFVLKIWTNQIISTNFLTMIEYLMKSESVEIEIQEKTIVMFLKLVNFKSCREKVTIFPEWLKADLTNLFIKINEKLRNIYEKQSVIKTDSFLKNNLVDTIFLRMTLTDNSEEVEETEWLIYSFRFLNCILDEFNANKIAQILNEFFCNKIFNFQTTIEHQIIFTLSNEIFFKLFKNYLTIVAKKNSDLVPNFLNAILLFPFGASNFSKLAFFKFFDLFLAFFDTLIENFAKIKISAEIIQLTKQTAQTLILFDYDFDDAFLFEQKLQNLTDLSAKLIIQTKDYNLNEDYVIDFIEIAYLILKPRSNFMYFYTKFWKSVSKIWEQTLLFSKRGRIALQILPSLYKYLEINTLLILDDKIKDVAVLNQMKEIVEKYFDIGKSMIYAQWIKSFSLLINQILLHKYSFIFCDGLLLKLFVDMITSKMNLASLIGYSDKENLYFEEQNTFLKMNKNHYQIFKYKFIDDIQIENFRLKQNLNVVTRYVLKQQVSSLVQS